MQAQKTTAEQLEDYTRLVKRVLWTILTTPKISGETEIAARHLFNDPKWIGTVVGKHVLEPDREEREQLHAEMANMGFNLPSLLDSSSGESSFDS